MRSMIHRSPLDPAVLGYVSPRPTIIHFVLVFARRGARQSLDAVAVASDAGSKSRRIACAAGLAVGEGAEFGAELFFEED